MYNYNLFLGYITPLGSTLFLDNYSSNLKYNVGDDFILEGSLLEQTYGMLSIFNGNKKETLKVIKIDEFEENEQKMTGDLYIVFEKDFK